MKWYKVRSGAIQEVGYDAGRKVLIARFVSGSYIALGGVPEHEAANLCLAPNPRDYWVKHFENPTGHYLYQRLPTEPFEPVILQPRQESP